MPFIGNQPALSYTSFAKQDFTTSATTSYTLDHPVTNANELALFINFVRQEPTTAYTASGTTLTLTSATSATDDMYCVFLGKAVQTVNPPSGSVGLSQLSATGTKDATTFLRGDNTFASAGGANTPAFEAYLSANQTVSDGVETKVQVNTEVFDTDNCYDNSTNYRFTPTVAGKYFVYGKVAVDEAAGNTRLGISMIYKNGSEVGRAFVNFDIGGSSGPEGEGCSVTNTAIVDMNGSSDYVELYGAHDVLAGSGRFQGDTTRRYTSFGAYKIIT